MPNESMPSPLVATWDWSYRVDHAKLDELYAKAKRDQWNADVAIDWSAPVDPAAASSMTSGWRS